MAERSASPVLTAAVLGGQGQQKKSPLRGLLLQKYGGLCWTRTSDPYRVKVVL